MSGLANIIGGPWGSIAQMGIGLLESGRLRGAQPQAPNLSEQIQRRPWRPGGLPGSSSPEARAPSTIASPTQIAGQVARAFPKSAQFPGYTREHVTDALRRYGRDYQKRGQEIGAAEQFSEGFQGGMAQMRRNVDRDYGQTLRAGTQGFERGREQLDMGRLAADEARKETIQSTTQLIQNFKTQMDSAMSEMRGLKDEALAEAKDYSSQLLVQQARAMDMNTRAQVEDYMAEAQASGMTKDRMVGDAAQIRVQGSQAIGNQLANMSGEFANQRNAIRLQADTNMANLQGTLAAAYGDVTRAGIQEMGVAQRTWADQQIAISDAHRMLETDAANWRASVNSNRSWVETQIREAHLRGATIEADMWSNLTIPLIQLGPIAEGLLMYDIGEIQTQFAFDQAEFANEMNITAFGMDQVNMGLDRLFAYRELETQREIARDTARYGLWGSVLGAGADVGAGALMGPGRNLFEGSQPGYRQVGTGRAGYGNFR